ncbi:MAG: tRNA lysidine(34) synthetase TilS [Coriobacteriales bacterium]|jgi:tRNA(Ile)-lysidine synthase|nr:tRNA lysidine(34) synthetase TilS [Coriobacteriales bacterium]
MDENELIEGIGTTIAAHDMLPSAASVPVVLMVSGGSDSVALARLLPRLCPRHNYCVLHINHMLRPQDAEKDERFVIQLSRQLGLDCESRRVDVAALAAAETNGNIEELGRRVRYQMADELLDTLCQRVGIDPARGRIATAHTRDDRVETFLMRIVVGAGNSGLGAIPFVNGRVIRPLLDCAREDLRDFLRAAGVGAGVAGAGAEVEGAGVAMTPDAPAVTAPGAPDAPDAPAPDAPAPDAPAPALLWREDDSNADTRRLRAFVRHELIPLMTTRNPRLVRGIARSLEVIGAEDALLTRLAALVEQRCVQRREEGLAIDMALFEEDRALVRRVVRSACKRVMPPEARVTFEHIENIVENGRHIGFATDIPGDVTVRNVYGTLVIRRKTAAEKPRHRPRQGRPARDA